MFYFSIEVEILRKHQVNGITSFISGLGVIFLLIGIFTSYYDFGIGIILGMVCWIGSGVLESFIEEEDRPRRRRHPAYSPPKQENTYSKVEKTRSKFCYTCGNKLDQDSIFCPQCGSETRQ